MTIATVSRGSAVGLPQPLKRAQTAIHLPEVQDMLRRLSEYKLGIFMPHVHDDATGDFLLLPDDVMRRRTGQYPASRQTQDERRVACFNCPTGVTTPTRLSADWADPRIIKEPTEGAR